MLDRICHPQPEIQPLSPDCQDVCSELSGVAAWGRISARGLDRQVISIELMLIQVRWILIAPPAAIGGLRTEV